MESTTTPFRLMDLPTELREDIFRFTVESPHPIAPRVSIPRDAFVLRLPPLTKVSRQFRQETLPLYFEGNIFHFNVKDVLETPLEQDLRFEKKLLTFGAWCEAAGRKRFCRIRSFSFSTGGNMHAPNVVVCLGRYGRLEMEVRCFWQGSGSRRPRYEAQAAPEGLIEVAKEAMARNDGSCLLPEDVIVLCREIQRLGGDSFFLK